MNDPRLAILGCGSMGEALVRGLLASGIPAGRIAATTRRADRARALAERHGIGTGTDNRSAVAGADLVVLSVKPQTAAELLPQLAADLTDKVAVSTCAGMRLRRLHELAPGARWIRAMPNTPALIREGMTVLAAGDDVADEELEAARAVFGAVGRCAVLDEQHLDAVTGLSGSGPAFVFVVLEAMADGGVMMGLPRDAALEFAAQTLQGAARLVLSGHGHPAALKDEVTTPAGCTIAGLLSLEDGGIRSTLARAIQEATRVARSLGDDGRPQTSNT